MQTSFDGVMHLLLPKKMPAEQADKLIKEFRQVTQRISEVGLLAYNEEADAKASTKRMGFGFLAKVDDSPAFVLEYVQLLQQLQQAMQKYGDSKFEVKNEQKRIADKPSCLITIRTPNGERKGGSKEKIDYSEQTLLLTEIDSRTVMGADLSNGAHAETLVKMFSQKPAEGLSANRGVKHTTSLLPKQPQVVVYISMATVMKVKNDTPPLAFALHTLPAGVESAVCRAIRFVASNV